jgi:hypothetical protein
MVSELTPDVPKTRGFRFYILLHIFNATIIEKGKGSKRGEQKCREDEEKW